MISPDSGPEISIYDWGSFASERLRGRTYKIMDTTLRDGIQTPGINHPTLEEKKEIVDYCAKINVDSMDICMPGSGGRWYDEGVEVARYMRETYPNMGITVLTRTIDNDVDATMRFAKEAGIDLSAILFRGSSDIRLLAEGWDQDELVEQMFQYSRVLTQAGINVICATEDTTRTRPDFLAQVFLAGKAGGAKEFCIADTVGYAGNDDVRNLTLWVRNEIIAGDDGLHIQFHGHNDLGQATSNALAALGCEADVVQVTIGGLGERCGNTRLEELLGALYSRGVTRYDISHLMEASARISQITGLEIPVNAPITGKNAFTTSTGIHAAGIHNALERELPEVAQIVYSAISPNALGREHTINIGPLSGRHNAEFVLQGLGNKVTEDRVSALLAAGRSFNRDLTLREVRNVLREANHLSE